MAIVVGWELMKTVDSKTGADILGRAAFYEKEAKGLEFPFSQLFGNLCFCITKPGKECEAAGGSFWCQNVVRPV